MADKRIIAIIIIVIISFSLIIAIPIMTFSTIFSSYSKIDEMFTFYYNPSNSSETIQLNLSADVGNIEIKYIDRFKSPMHHSKTNNESHHSNHHKGKVCHLLNL